MVCCGRMRRIPLSFRALMLVPLFALAVDHLRVSMFCAGGTESCLQAAGGGLLGPLGVLVLGVYAAVLALAVGRFAGRGGRPPSFGRLWLTSTGGLAAVCGGHALLASLLGDGAAAASGWLPLLPLLLVAGAVLALALRIAPAAIRLLRRLRPRAPRLRAAAATRARARATAVTAISRVADLTAAGRAPPRTLG